MPLARRPPAGTLLAATLLAWLALPVAAPAASKEIPIERCDRLPVVTVRIGGEDRRFLVDTAATSMLNLKSFSQGKATKVRISSWKETSVTSAREVTLPDLRLGGTRLRNLKLPAIDLSPIAQACGGPIDGILGVDLLERLGATLDLKRRVARLENPPGESKEAAILEEYRAIQRKCLAAFNRADTDYLEGCLDPEIVLFTPWGEFRGRQAVMDYLRKHYFRRDPPARFELRPNEFRAVGDAVWYSYDYTIQLPDGLIEARGMALCRKSQGRWRILNMHNSFAQQRDAPAR